MHNLQLIRMVSVDCFCCISITCLSPLKYWLLLLVAPYILMACFQQLPIILVGDFCISFPLSRVWPKAVSSPAPPTIWQVVTNIYLIMVVDSCFSFLSSWVWSESDSSPAPGSLWQVILLLTFILESNSRFSFALSLV